MTDSPLGWHMDLQEDNVKEKSVQHFSEAKRQRASDIL